MQISDNMKGAALMMASMTAFTVNDAFMKAMAGQVPLFQAIWLRGVGVVFFLTVLCVALGQVRWDVSRKDWVLMVTRALCELAGACLFLTALFNMPLANVSAILQVLPLTVSLAGAVFLGAALGWRRMTAILVGFAGVLLIVRPGADGFNVYALCALGAVVVVTARDLVVRRMSKDVPSLQVALVAAVIVTTGAGLVSLTAPRAPLDAWSAAMLAGAAVSVLGGYVFSVMTMRVGDISFVAPFRYVSLIAAIILGYLVFDDFPDGLTLIGAGIVVVTGLFTLWREARLRVMQDQGRAP